MIERYSMPSIFNVRVETYYKGERIYQNFFDENPTLRDTYIKDKEFTELYALVKSQTINGMKSLITITETGYCVILNDLPL